MRNHNHTQEDNPPQHHLVINIKDILKDAIIAGLVIFIVSYGGLYLAIKIFPEFFINYINPVFNSDGSRDTFFYMHPFILGISLSIFWSRFYKFFRGNIILTGLEFGVTYGFVALLPILWITYAAMDVEFQMVASWMIYGVFQSSIAGMIFYLLNKNKRS
jgi:hypothetical protein